MTLIVRLLLYELLPGSTPFDRQRLRSAAFDEVPRIIREEEPSKPNRSRTVSHNVFAVVRHEAICGTPRE